MLNVSPIGRIIVSQNEASSKDTTTLLASVRKWSKFYKRSSKNTTSHTPSAARYPSMFSQKAGTRLSAFSLSKGLRRDSLLR